MGRFLHVFFDELRRSGVEHVCISPGSRSTPLTLAAHHTPGLQCSVHLDERSAGFFALGLARGKRQPVALVCTSGTAAANYLPAVAEAGEAGIPLIVLTADRPPELRDCGAGQTIDQLKLYGQLAKRFVEVAPAPGERTQQQGDDTYYRFARSLACRSVIDAAGAPAGVVHLNWPLREPFDLADYSAWIGSEAPVNLREPGAAAPAVGRFGRANGQALVDAERGATGLTGAQLDWLGDCVRTHPQGVIICGALEPDAELGAAIAVLADVTGWPVLADPLSQLRCGEHVSKAPLLSCADWLLRDERCANTLRPDVALCFGGPPVSKAQRLWLESAPPRHVLAVDHSYRWEQPSHLLSAVYAVDPLLFCRQLSAVFPESRHSPWRRRWMEAQSAITGLLERVIEGEPVLLESRVVRELARLLPADSALFVSNSMPVRDLDAFLTLRGESLAIYCNRGVNGIDGVLSSALGVAAAGRPVTLLIGDLALLHDIGALLTARRLGLNLTIVVINNDGGAIFSYLPVAEQAERVGFDELYTVSHGMEFSAAAGLYGLDYARVDNHSAFCTALQQSQRGTTTTVIEVPVSAAAAASQRRRLVAEVSGLLQRVALID